MLTIVIEKPIQFTIVSDEPLIVLGTEPAMSVENIGESATTLNPQVKRKRKRRKVDGWDTIKGVSKQHTPDTMSDKSAIFRGGFF